MTISLFLHRSFDYQMPGTQTFNKILFSLFFCLFAFILTAEEDINAITTIILINGSAELVDVNIQGEILKRHISIPDYFSSGRSHEGSLGKGMKMIEQYGATDSNFLPQSSLLPAKCLQSFMVSISQSLEKVCSNHSNVHLFNTSSSDFSLMQTIDGEKNNTLGDKEENQPPRPRIQEGPSFFSSSEREYYLRSSDSVISYVYRQLKFFSAKSKEPLRHRIV